MTVRQTIDPHRRTSGPRRVYQIGPEPASARSRGGMATVMDLIAQHPDERFVQVIVPTSHDGHKVLRHIEGLRGLLRAGRAMRAGRVDVLHVHLSFKGSVVRKGVLLHLAVRAGVPTVVHAHSGGFARWFAALPSWQQAGVRALLSPAGHWLVLGQDWRGEYVDMIGLDPSVVEVLPNPVDWAAMSPENRVPRRDRLRALFLGNLLERKGVFDIVAAIAALPEHIRKQVDVVMAGDGPVDDVRAVAERAEVGTHFAFPGWVDSAARAELLRNADVFLLPSHREALPMSLLEAMASGLAVVTSPVGSIPEVVDQERTGLLVEPGDVPGLAAAIRRLVEDDGLIERLGTAARMRSQDFDLQHWYASLASVWDRVVPDAAR